MTRLLAHTQVQITRNGRTLATATVIEHTDDSDEYVGNAEQWLRLHVIRALDERLVAGPMTLRRPFDAEDDEPWALKNPRYRNIGRVTVGATS